MTKVSEDCTTLIFKNIPKEIEDLTNLLETLHIPAQQIKPFGRKRALITYQNKNEAEQALKTLNELEFNGKTVNIALFLPNKSKENQENQLKTITKKSNKKVQTNMDTSEQSSLLASLAQQQINKYVQKLYAIEGDLGFDQPPPPYLKYRYPPINKLILDNICSTLLSNKRFYTQVLHLMNRMNLEPPFAKRTYKFTQPGIPKDTSTQTEDVIIKENISSSVPAEEDIESELETSEEEDTLKQQTCQIKRKLPPQDEQYKKKARQMLQNVQKQNKEIETKKHLSSTTNLSVKDIFDSKEQSTSSMTQHKIALNLKSSSNANKSKDTKDATKFSTTTTLDLQNTTKLSLNELSQLSIFKNYQKGLPSNKLYIKNLHKDVTNEDLQLIYAKYLKDSNISLDIKVMQHGRMKGQAFVTFQYEHADVIQPLIEQALEDTNGFVLRDKPMVVCYGKQT